MLILKRRMGDVITINDNIEIVLIDANTRNARIGICAPKDVSISRRDKKAGQRSEHSIDVSSDTNAVD